MYRKLRIIWLPLLFVAMFAADARAQTYLWIEPQMAIDRVRPEKTLISRSWVIHHEGGDLEYEERFRTEGIIGEYFGNLSFGHQWNPWLGLFVQSAHGNFWGETAIGPSFMLSDELQVGVGVGIEHYAPNPMRLRGNLYWDHEGTGSFGYLQVDTSTEGNEGWVWADGAYMFNSIVGIGGILQMPDAGVGPKLELRAGDHLGFWVAPVYDWRNEQFRTLVGGRLMFDK